MMKKYYIPIIFALLFFCPALIFGADIPKNPDGRINDYAKVIDADSRAKLDNLLNDLDAKTSAEIAVVTVRSIVPLDEKEYARKIFDTWHIGKKGKDNGLLILLAVDQRRWRIESGYGLEGILPDGKCGEIGRTYMVPLFKEGKYGQGLYYGAAAIASIISKDANVELDSLKGVKVAQEDDGENVDIIASMMLLAAIFITNILADIFSGFFMAIAFSLFLFMFSPLFAMFGVVSYILGIVFRLILWLNLPKDKRKSFFKSQSFGSTFNSGSSRWGGGRGGWGGGGWGGGGGFGGGRGGGGGSGGGF